MNSEIQIVISAPSGAGKSTIINELLKDKKYMFSVSSTSRKARGSEIDGVHYHYLSKEEFKRRIEGDEFLEWAIVHGNYYGTEKKEIDIINLAESIPIFDLDIQGAKSLKSKLINAVFIFIVPPSLEVLEKRLINRKTDSSEHIKIRLNNAIIEIKSYHYFDYIIINDDIEEAVKKLKSIITAELCKKKRNIGLMKTMEA